MNVCLGFFWLGEERREGDRKQFVYIKAKSSRVKRLLAISGDEGTLDG